MVEAGAEVAAEEEATAEEAGGVEDGELAAEGLRVTPAEEQSCWAKARAATKSDQWVYFESHGEKVTYIADQQRCRW